MKNGNSKNAPEERGGPVLRPTAAASYLTIGLRTLRTLAESGKIPVVRLSPRRIGFLRSDLDRYVAQQRG
jgi:excisionase family DNA binding protein